MQFREVLRKRRSIRAYKVNPIPEASLSRIWEAVQLAPTACNLQPFQFLLLLSDAKKETVYRWYQSTWLRQAPAIIVALGNRELAWKRLNGTSIHSVDTAIAMEHLMLAAAAEGLGTCWICAFDQDLLHAELELAPEWEILAITPIGFPAESPPERNSKPVKDLVRIL